MDLAPLSFETVATLPRPINFTPEVHADIKLGLMKLMTAHTIGAPLTTLIEYARCAGLPNMTSLMEIEMAAEDALKYIAGEDGISGQFRAVMLDNILMAAYGMVTYWSDKIDMEEYQQVAHKIQAEVGMWTRRIALMKTNPR